MPDSEFLFDKDVLDCIIEMLKFGIPPEKQAEIDSAREVLQTVESAFQYYVSESSSRNCPIFYLPRIVPSMEQILSDYIVIRFGVLTSSFRATVRKEHNSPEAFPAAGTKEYQEFYKETDLINAKGVRYRSVGSARRAFNALAYRMIDSENSEILFPESPCNILVCDRSLLPPLYTSLLSKHIKRGFSVTSSLSVLTDDDVDAIKRKVRTAANRELISKDNPSLGNAFIIYTNSQRYRSFKASEVFSKLSQRGLIIQNLFVFRITDKTYSLKTLMDEKAHFCNIYHGQSNSNQDFVCFPVEEADAKTRGLLTCANRFRVESEENDFDIYFPEVEDLIEGFDISKRYLCNLISLCATKECENAFYEFLKSIDSSFSPDRSISIFDYLRRIWNAKILPYLYEFIGRADSVAMVIEPSTPATIKEELSSLFPGIRIVFRRPVELVPKKGRISIPEEKIIVMRFLPCKSYPSTYPNSYEPYIINPGQCLVEVIPDILFKGFIDYSNANQTRNTNIVFNSGYSRDVLHWKPRLYTRDRGIITNFDIFGNDDRFDDGDLTNNSRTVILELDDGSISNPIETEPVVYKTSEGIYVAVLRDLVDNQSVEGVQFLSELERELDDLLDKSDDVGIRADGNLRDYLSKQYPGFDFSIGEIWKLVLKAKIAAHGIENVKAELSTLLDEKSIENRIKDWSDLSSTTMLPKKRRTRKALFEYLGIADSTSYMNSLHSRYRRALRNSRYLNRLMDELLGVVIGNEITQDYYISVKQHYAEAFDLFDINDHGDLRAIQAIVNERINIKRIKSITTND